MSISVSGSDSLIWEPRTSVCFTHWPSDQSSISISKPPSSSVKPKLWNACFGRLARRRVPCGQTQSRNLYARACTPTLVSTRMCTLKNLLHWWLQTTGSSSSSFRVPCMHVATVVAPDTCKLTEQIYNLAWIWTLICTKNIHKIPLVGNHVMNVHQPRPAFPLHLHRHHRSGYLGSEMPASAGWRAGVSPVHMHRPSSANARPTCTSLHAEFHFNSHLHTQKPH